MMILFLFLVYPFSSNWINPDAEGLLFSTSPFLPEKNTGYLSATALLGYGTRASQPDTNDRHYYGFGFPCAGYTITPQLELFAGGHGYGKYFEARSYPLYRADTRTIQWPQAIGGLKAVFPSAIGGTRMSFGVMLFTAYWFGFDVENVSQKLKYYTGKYIITGNDTFHIWNPIFATTYKQDIEVGLRGMFGIESSLGTTYLNVGYLRIVWPDSQSGFNSASVGQLVNLWPYLQPGIEYVMQDTFVFIVPQVKIPFKITDVIRGSFSAGLAIPLKEFDWVPETPGSPYDTLDKTPGIVFNLNVGYTVRRPPPLAKNIVISGRAYDSLSLAPVPIEIGFIGPTSGKVKSGGDGNYEIRLPYPGSYRVGIEAPDYSWQERVFELMDYDTVRADFSLQRQLDWSITGKILSKKTKKGLPAMVKFIGKNGAETLTDPETGEFKLWVHSGVYTIYIESEGYTPKEYKNIKITNAKTITRDIPLIPEM